MPSRPAPHRPPQKAVAAALQRHEQHAKPRSKHADAGAHAVAAAAAAVCSHSVRAQVSAAAPVSASTAAAIAAIAFNQPAAPVDGNIERVLSRLAADTTPLPKLKARIKAYNASLVPAERPGDFAQAMMDLGSSLCTPKRPACGDGPWQADCAAHASGVAETLPRKAPKREKPERRGTVYWLENKAGDVWMARRPEKGLLGGMYMFPSQGWDPANDAPLDTLAPGTWTPLSGEVVHVFTHFRLTLTVEARTWPHDDPPPIEGRWVAPHDFANVALPSVMVKVAKHVLS